MSHVHRQRLTQHEEVLVAPVAGQRLGDLLGAGFDAAVPVQGQRLGVALTGKDRPDDRLAGHAHHIGEHLRELDVHLNQRLLHALHPTGLLDEQHLALAGHRANDADLAIRTPGRAQKSQAHELL